MINTRQLIEQLKRHEGFRKKPYQCTAGKTTIGYGRNLDDVGIHEVEAHTLLVNDINAACEELNKRYPSFLSLDLPRKNVLINMVFNLGITRFSNFKKMIAAVENKQYEQAAKEMMSSKWANQVGDRAKELARQMRTGSF